VSLDGDFDKHSWLLREVCVFEKHLRDYLQAYLAAPLDVNDCVQETYARLLNCSDDKLQHIKVCSAFVFTVARNVAIEWSKREARFSPSQAARRRLMKLPDDARSGFEELSEQQDLNLLNLTLAALPKRCGHVLRLRRLEGLSQKLIAEKLHITENTVEKHANNALKRCAIFMAQHR
jgi:RNA polymerase sigma factor (sigma-70 family)